MTGPGASLCPAKQEKDQPTVTPMSWCALWFGTLATMGVGVELHGVTGKPYNTPQVRRKLPAPFTRNRINLDGGSRVQRSWQDVSVLDVAKGDTVAEFGTVAERVEFVEVPDGEGFNDVTPRNPVWRVRLYNVVGDWKDYPGEQRVFVFAREPKLVGG